MLSHRSLYATFDRFPSSKGAGTHIARMATTLFDEMDGGLLYVLGGGELPFYQREGNVEIVRYAGDEPNFLDRALGFGERLELLLEGHAEHLELCHFRDPWSGVPILSRADRRYGTVYEVNGLPSIELPYSYPWLSRSTLAKIRNAEEFCWRAADAIVTPSESIASNLVRLGADPSKISVIPNGADIPSAHPPRHPDAPGGYIIYIGALQPWQGVEHLLRAYGRLAARHDIGLVICASIHPRRAKIYRKLAERLGIGERVIWRHMLGKAELASWLGGALLSIAPLTECSRNIEQGCAPLKILESMALGVPVLAADLPAVREIISDGIDGFLVRADRPAELARAIELLIEEPDRLRETGTRGRARIERDLTWDHLLAGLRELYRDLLNDRAAEDHILAAEYRPPDDL